MREGRLGFPRPFADILSKYRPLIPPKFADAPSNIGVIATRIDENIGNDVTITRVNGKFAVDFLMNVPGIDEVSRSSLIFTQEGDFLGGQVRLSTFKSSRGVSVDQEQLEAELKNRWIQFLEKRINLDREKDDITPFIRTNTGSAAEHPPLTPHLTFSSRQPIIRSSSSNSPLSTSELLSVLEDIQENFESEFSRFRFAGRVKRRTTGEQSDITLEDESTESMLDLDIL